MDNKKQHEPPTEIEVLNKDIDLESTKDKETPSKSQDFQEPEPEAQESSSEFTSQELNDSQAKS